GTVDFAATGIGGAAAGGAFGALAAGAGVAGAGALGGVAAGRAGAAFGALAAGWAPAAVCTANNAPLASSSCAMRPPPGTGTGPCTTFPPALVTAATAASISVTVA